MPQTVVRVFKDGKGKRPYLDWLDAIEKSEPKAYFKSLEKVLRLAEVGNQLRRPEADLLRDGIYELRYGHGKVNYRTLYFFCGKNEACISHGLTKEGEVPEKEIDLAVARKKLVESNKDAFTVQWE